MNLARLSSLGVVTVLVFCQLACSAVQAADQSKESRVSGWFKNYDQIRGRAQMSPIEKQQSSRLMMQSVTAQLLPSADNANDKVAAGKLLQKMVGRYQTASAAMDALPRAAETKKLHEGYSRYFKDATALFVDYLKVQNNLFATDASGNSIVAQLQQRRSELEVLDAKNKELDAQLRDKYRVAPYAFL